MKKVIRIFSLVLCFTLALAMLTPTLAAYSIAEVSNTAVNNIVNKVGGTVIGVLKLVGYIVAVVMVLWVGMQWMLAQPAKKAELKTKMWSMLIGVVLLAGGVTILGAVYDAATKISITSGS